MFQVISTTRREAVDSSTNYITDNQSKVFLALDGQSHVTHTITQQSSPNQVPVRLLVIELRVGL